MHDPLDPRNRSTHVSDGVEASHKTTAATQTTAAADATKAKETQSINCGCNSDLPCDTYRRCTAQTRQSRARMLDEGSEGDDMRYALAAQVAAERYDNLVSRSAEPETAELVANLAELHDACSEYLSRTATDRQIELYNRVHLLLDWDERREILRLLNSVERLDGIDGEQDCFAARQTFCINQRETIAALLYKLCCFDNDFLERPQQFRKICLCGNSDICVNPQHYFSIELQHCRRYNAATTTTTTTRRRLRKRNRDEDDDSDAESTNTRQLQTLAEVAAFDLQKYITEHAADTVEQARLAAISVCLEDQKMLQQQCNSFNDSSSIEAAPRLLTHQQSDKLRQPKEDYFDFVDHIDIRHTDRIFAGAKTPTLLPYAEACRSSESKPPPKPIVRPSFEPILVVDATHSLPQPPLPPPPRQTPQLLFGNDINEHCKSMANRVEQLLRAHHALDVII